MTGEDPGFFSVVRSQRACRSFAADPVPDANLAAILDAAVHAPSAENRQPWVFLVVRDASVRAAIDDLHRRLWETARTQAAGRLESRLFADVERSAESGFGGAPVLVVVAGDTRSGASRRGLGSSIFPAVQNLLLAATALGYGSALTTLTAVAADELRSVLELPDGVEPMAVVPLGRPAHPLGPPSREPAAEKTHTDRFDER